MHLPIIEERFGLSLSLYQQCGPYRESLSQQLFINNRLKEVAQDLKLQPSKKARLHVRDTLPLINAIISKPFCTCLDPKTLCTSIIPINKVMESKKMPLWVVFSNVNPAAQTSTPFSRTVTTYVRTAHAAAHQLRDRHGEMTTRRREPQLQHYLVLRASTPEVYWPRRRRRNSILAAGARRPLKALDLPSSLPVEEEEEEEEEEEAEAGGKRNSGKVSVRGGQWQHCKREW